MDAFYVSVELLGRPDLVGRPVVVGGTSDRGVVSAASYEARRFGVHSAMASSRARKLCPNAVFLPANHALYLDVSAQLHEILLSFTPLVEPISVDEAFLDVSGSASLFGSAVDIAWAIRGRVQNELRLSCSVGVAPNKFIAKLASEHAKPRATPSGVDKGFQVFEVRPGEELRFLHQLDVSSLWGVGPATLEKLSRVGVRTVADLADLGENALHTIVGRAHGSHLFALSHGLDDREVEPDRVAKSIGHEETFDEDVHDGGELRAHLVRLSDAVARRVRRAGVAAGTVLLKVKFSNFQSITRSTSPSVPLTTGPGFVAALAPLLGEIDPSQGVRLLGVHAQKLTDPRDDSRLFEDASSRVEDVERQWAATNSAIDDIVGRFGRDAIRPASALGERAPGESPFGPDANESPD